MGRAGRSGFRSNNTDVERREVIAAFILIFTFGLCIVLGILNMSPAPAEAETIAADEVTDAETVEEVPVVDAAVRWDITYGIADSLESLADKCGLEDYDEGDTVVSAVYDPYGNQNAAKCLVKGIGIPEEQRSLVLRGGELDTTYVFGRHRGAWNGFNVSWSTDEHAATTILVTADAKKLQERLDAEAKALKEEERQTELRREQERKVRAEEAAAEKKAKEEAERKAKEEAEKARKAQEAREEAERKAKEEAERKEREAKEAAERQAREAQAEKERQEREAKEAAERAAQEEAARKAQEEAARKAQEEAARQQQQQAAQESYQPRVYYKNCKAVWEALGHGITRNDPGYASHLDRDGDGKACEWRPTY
ncbi:MAG: excalibur calcium-binding domain-containing protein [Bifidobacteriaceae bacterium]|nr:excalibur calcium-binding domain-containing protein [Bifidobacteriaceae bacterium]